MRALNPLALDVPDLAPRRPSRQVVLQYEASPDSPPETDYAHQAKMSESIFVGARLVPLLSSTSLP